MPDRFYVPDEWSSQLTLEGEEAHHLARVLRATPGRQIELFDGRGKSSLAEVVTVSKRSVVVQLLGEARQSIARNPEIVLATAIPKGERLRWMIEKVTELGVDRLIPLATTRSVVEPSEQKLHKLEQISVAACKQSGRNDLLQIDELCSLPDLERRLAFPSCHFVFGSPQGRPVGNFMNQKFCDVRTFVAVIGPEGGFTAEEEALIGRWGGISVSLAPHILRVETAAIAFGAWLSGCRMSALPVES